MKRKRVNKKRKPKKPQPAARSSPSHSPAAAGESSSSVEELQHPTKDMSDPENGNIGGSKNANEISRTDDAPASHMAVDAPTPVDPVHKEKTPPPPPLPRPVAKQPLVVFNRVKVKLKTAKPPSSAPAVISPPDNNNVNSSSSNCDKNESDITKRKNDESGRDKVEERIEESAPVIKGSTVGCAASPAVAEGTRKEEPNTARKPRFDKLELDSALMIIKKVMKMDAAEPFNVPVNPEALGIPDYFDVIGTPMDFGTICSNFEKGKYMNSEDVYRDVQFIWDNCSKYNKKGDYIVDLMKRVKKNFMKYWTAAGLYTEPTRGSSGTDGVTGEDIVASTHAPAKTKKTKKRHGRRHKSDCLCAICVLKRRRREREENEQLAKGQGAATDQEHKQEGSSLMESPDGGEDSSSDMGESQDPDAEVEVEEKEQEFKVEAERQSATLEDKPDVEVAGENEDKEEEEEEENEGDAKRRKIEVSGQFQFTEKLAEGHVQQLQQVAAEDESTVYQKDTNNAPELEQPEEKLTDFLPAKHKELLKSAERAKLRDRFQADNPLLVGLCSSLFPHNRRSVWNGPHSLAPYRGPTRKSSLHEAIEALMK